MHLQTKVTQTMTQKQKLSHQQQYALKILAMSDIQLQREINTMIEENPLLDYADEYNTSRTSEDMFEKASLYVHTSETLQDVLYLQLHTCDAHIPNDLAEYLIESLDANGYLSTDTLQSSGYDEDSIEDALAILQTFEPAGVFARDVQECMLIQLCFKEMPHAQTAIMIVNYHMLELSLNQQSKIAHALNTSLDEIHAAIDLIRSLQPKPGAKYASDAIAQVADAKISVQEETLHIQMRQTTSSLRMNHQYDTLEDEVAMVYIRKAHKQADLFLSYLHKRNATLTAILACICNRQRGFFLYGEDIKPLTLKDVANEVNFHESTISRAISQKIVEFEGRHLPLKTFFSTRLHTGQSATAIHHKIRTIIETEDSTKPYSDQQIVQVLENENIKVSRRTVAKYREQMKLPAANQRKVFVGGK